MPVKNRCYLDLFPETEPRRQSKIKEIIDGCIGIPREVTMGKLIAVTLADENDCKNDFQQSLSPESLNEISSHLVQVMCRTYSDSIQFNSRNIKLVDGLLKYLNSLEEKAMLFVLSSAPHDDVVAMAKEKGVFDIFDRVEGGASPKHEGITRIVNSVGVATQECVYYGDQHKDELSALSANVVFVGINKDSGVFKTSASVKDFTEIL